MYCSLVELPFLFPTAIHHPTSLPPNDVPSILSVSHAARLLRPPALSVGSPTPSSNTLRVPASLYLGPCRGVQSECRLHQRAPHKIIAQSHSYIVSALDAGEVWLDKVSILNSTHYYYPESHSVKYFSEWGCGHNCAITYNDTAAAKDHNNGRASNLDCFQSSVVKRG